MPAGYEVGTASLMNASSDIMACVDPVKNIDLESAGGSSEWYGHSGLHQALMGFCGTWQLAVMLLGQRAGSAADALVGAARAYSDTEENTHDTINLF